MEYGLKYIAFYVQKHITPCSKHRQAQNIDGVSIIRRRKYVHTTLYCFTVARRFVQTHTYPN